MNTLLFVDDEPLEREGISHLLNWEENGIDFLGAAKNGVEAYDWILKSKPDIVLTDVKMPVVSGIDLIEKVRKKLPDIEWIVLSGYGDYAFTSKAMLYGVKHYLLKPVDEKNLRSALQSVQQELEQKRQERQAVNGLTGKLERVLPYVKEQFLRSQALTGIYRQQESKDFQTMFGISDGPFRVVTLLPERMSDFIKKYALRNIAEEMLGWEAVVLGTVMEEQVALLFQTMQPLEIRSRLKKVQAYYQQYFQMSFSAAVSRPGSFSEIHELYQETVALLKLRYDFPEGAVLLPDSIQSYQRSSEILSNIDAVYQAVQAGQLEEVNCQLELLGNSLQREKLSARAKLNECNGLFHAVAMLVAEPRQREELLQNFRIDDTEAEVWHQLKAACNQVAELYNGKRKEKKNPIVESVVKLVYENISNPELSLKWIARNWLYMNEEYLGRLFYRSMHQKFSAFLTTTRMEMAKKLFENTNNLKVHEVARMTGFPEDAQYFSKIFKSFVGTSPQNYQKQARRE